MRLVSLAITLASMGAAHAALCSTYTGGSFVLDPTVNYTIQWKTNSTSLSIALTTAGTGWVGFGLAEPGGGTMKGADILSCSMVAGVPTCKDYHGPWKSYSTINTPNLLGLAPVPDTHNDWNLIHGEITSGGGMAFELTRLLNTTDLQDRVIGPGANEIIWAHGNTSAMVYHNGNRGIGTINFITNTLPTLPAYTNYTDLRVNNFLLPAVTTFYGVQSFVLPTDKNRHIVAFEPLVDSRDANFVHHMVLYACPGNNTYWQHFQNGPKDLNGFGIGSCSSAIYAYAHVATPYILPSNVGLPIGPSDQWGINGGYVLLEYHYNNPNQLNNVLDSSGVRVYYTDVLRQYNAGGLELGDSALKFPALTGSQIQHRQSICPAGCTSKALDTASQALNYPGYPTTASITVFASFLHMHSFGRKVMTLHYSNTSSFLGVTNRVDYWDGGYQKYQFQAPPTFTINAGDTLFTHCYYDVSATNGTSIVFGEPTTDEMCLDFLLYYPKIPNFATCGYKTGGTLCGNGTATSFIPGPANSTFQQDPYGTTIIDPNAAVAYLDPSNFGSANLASSGYSGSASQPTCGASSSTTTTTTPSSSKATSPIRNSSGAIKVSFGAANALVLVVLLCFAF